MESNARNRRWDQAKDQVGQAIRETKDATRRAAKATKDAAAALAKPKDPRP